VKHHRQPQYVLDQLIEAARSEPGPAIDFDQLQATVRKVWLGRVSVQPRVLLHWRLAGAVAVAVSFFIGGWFGHAHHQSEEGTNSVHEAMHALDGRALLVGQELDSGREPLTVNHPGIAQWTLGPEGIARLSAKGEYLTVRLDIGRIDVEAVHSNRRESFAVETGPLRIAVHGTAFSVQKHNDSVEVSVSSGTVIVGPSGQPGQTKGTLLTVPHSQRFAINSNPSVEPEPTREQPPSGAPALRIKGIGPVPVPSTNNPAEEASASVEIPPNDHPARVELQAALDAVRAAAARCFAQAKASEATRDSHVTVRVDTQLSIAIAPSGKIGEASFEPPIPGAILECTQREFADWSTSPSKLGGLASRPIMLVR